MTITDLPFFRLNHQKISSTEFDSAGDLIKWMGAMQAQDYQMAKWAVGTRIKNATDSKVEAAFNRGEIIRTHVMRPTWHFVSPDDIGWMLKLTAPHIRSSMQSRNKQLEITPTLLAKSNKLIEKVLASEKYATRDRLSEEFKKAKIDPADNRFAHLLMEAELDGLICSGPVIEKKQTYAFLSDRVPSQKDLTREEALAELASRYFTSHGPASLADFVWWSGLPVGEAKKGLESVKSQLHSETINTIEYWFNNVTSKADSGPNRVYLLPAYDEFLISYKDRNASLVLTHNKKTISNNGIFYPIVVIHGQVAGTWKRTTQKTIVQLELELFQESTKTTLKLIEQSASRFESFIGKKIIISFLP